MYTLYVPSNPPRYAFGSRSAGTAEAMLQGFLKAIIDLDQEMATREELSEAVALLEVLVYHQRRRTKNKVKHPPGSKRKSSSISPDRIISLWHEARNRAIAGKKTSSRMMLMVNGNANRNCLVLNLLHPFLGCAAAQLRVHQNRMAVLELFSESDEELKRLRDASGIPPEEWDRNDAQCKFG